MSVVKERQGQDGEGAGKVSVNGSPERVTGEKEGREDKGKETEEAEG